jgi:hypothetical protein
MLLNANENLYSKTIDFIIINIKKVLENANHSTLWAKKEEYFRSIISRK